MQTFGINGEGDEAAVRKASSIIRGTIDDLGFVVKVVASDGREVALRSAETMARMAPLCAFA